MMILFRFTPLLCNFRLLHARIPICFLDYFAEETDTVLNFHVAVVSRFI